MAQKKRNLPIGVQSLSTIIEDNFIYIDKTKYIYDLIAGGRYYFLSRPRRFGKSLLISTLEEIFLGNRELFSSLYIDSTDYDWQEYPVIMLNFSSMASDTPELLKQDIAWNLQVIGDEHGIDLSGAPSIKSKFKQLIFELSKKNRVSILVDEYDYPILSNIENLEVADKCRDILRDFFAALKDTTVDKKLRFIFITGISKFSTTSIFSGLNNLRDLSLNPKTAQLLGYTIDEIKQYYSSYLEGIAQEGPLTVDEILERIKFWYNGYQFADPERAPDSKVYNPFSVMLYLEEKVFIDYWFDTGTPSFLNYLINKQEYAISKIEGSEVNISETKSYDIRKIKILPLLWQAGYLTIDSYNPRTRNFKLKFPNEEVKVSFYNHFLESLTEKDIAYLTEATEKLRVQLAKNDLEGFFESLKIFFAQIPYTMHLPQEKYYQSIFYVIMKLINADIVGEDVTNNGRIDATLITADHIYIIEFKLHGTAADALKQIEDKVYYQKYLDKGKKIVLVGVEFDLENRTVGKWITKQI